MVNLSGNDSNLNKTAVVMRKINEALLLASDEHEILAAIGLSANDDASLHLLYVDWDTQDPLNGLITKVAGWDSGNQSSSEELNMQRSIKDQLDISNFVRALANSGDPVWIVEDLSSAIGSAAYPYFALDCRGLAAVKLQSLGHSSTDPQHTWNSVICFTWSTPHQFSPEEKYIFAEISQFASVVVSNHRLHKQILANIARLQ